MTSQEEADYYMNQAKISEVISRIDSDYSIISERFYQQAELWQTKANSELKIQKENK